MNALILSLLAAFASVESSNRNLPAYDDHGGMAFGYYGFHEARWIECGGSAESFGTATREQQDAVMAKELTRAFRIAKKRGIDPIRAAATYHNNGHVIDSETAYTRKIRAALTKLSSP